MINHFRDSTSLTTKMGLNLLLKKNLIITDHGRDFT